LLITKPTSGSPVKIYQTHAGSDINDLQCSSYAVITNQFVFDTKTVRF